MKSQYSSEPTLIAISCVIHFIDCQVTLRISPKFENIFIQIFVLYSLPVCLPNFYRYEPLLIAVGMLGMYLYCNIFHKNEHEIKKILMYFSMPLTFSPCTGKAKIFKSEGFFKMRMLTLCPCSSTRNFQIPFQMMLADVFTFEILQN